MLRHKSKKPFEVDWQKTKNYTYDDKKLRLHINTGGNYGVVGGYGGLVILDADHSNVKLAIERNLPSTFTVKTGGGGTHFYYLCNELDKPIRLHDPNGGSIGQLGDVQSIGKQVVGPGSIHPNGKPYTILNDIPLKEINLSQIRYALRQFIKTDDENVKNEEKENVIKSDMDFNSLAIENVVNTSGLKMHGNELQGPHPIHGSIGGENFCINTSKNVWHCFRDDSGGGPLSWIAVQEGIINCIDARQGVLRDDKFKKVLKIAREKYGLKLISRKRTKIIKKKEKIPNPSDIANEIMNNYIFKTTKDNEELYYYYNGIYYNNGEILVKEEANKRYPDINTHAITEIIFHINAKTYTARDNFNNETKLVHLNNGLFDLGKMKLEKFTPNIISTVRIPVNYNPQSDCPKIKNFIDEVVDTVDIPIIQELFGYCLLKQYHIQKAFMFIGDGANGKSTLLSLLRTFIGRQNTSSIALQSFEKNRFASSVLYGKLANIYADLPDQSLYHTGQFKLLTGGDPINAEKKFKEQFSFMNYAKLIFSANKLPESHDESSAFFRRWIIINFPNIFEGSKCDKHILNKLTDENELSGLFNWAIEGLKRLLNNGDFSYSLTTEEIRDRYERLSSPLLAFVKDCVGVDPEGWVSKEELYSAYVKFCHKNNLPATAKNVIGRELPKYLPDIRDERRSIGNSRPTGWAGIKLIGQKEIPPSLETFDNFQIDITNQKGDLS